MRQKNAAIASPAQSRFFTALCLLALLAACSPITYNRYQPAQTMGEGQFKLAASAEFGKEMAANVQTSLAAQMDQKVLAWSTSHPLPGGRTLGAAGVGPPSSVGILNLPALSDPVPQANVYFAYGLTNTLDLEGSISTAPYFRFNAKAQVWQFGSRGAVAVAPGVGYLPFSESASGSGGRVKDKYSGYAATAELPVVVGWQYHVVSPYVGVLLAYNHIGLNFSRVDSDFTPAFSGFLTADYDLFSVGPMVGVQLKFGPFILTPELIALYAHGAGSGLVLPHSFFLSPGLQLGGQW